MKVYRTTVYNQYGQVRDQRTAETRNQHGQLLSMYKDWDTHALKNFRVTLEFYEIPEDAWEMQRDDRGTEYPEQQDVLPGMENL